MAAATSITRYMMPLGPVKVEFITATFAASGDTVVSNMQRPLYCMPMKNASGTAQTQSSISGRTITITDAGISASAVHMLVFGF